jgi:hypothetical protein
VPTSSTIAVSAAGNSIYVINTSTGHLVQCGAFNNLGTSGFGGLISSTPFGSCVDKGTLSH